MRSLREEIERGARESNHPRDALLERAVFYLLWQGSLRLGEAEELRLEDLDPPDKRLTVRNGTGLTAPSTLRQAQGKSYARAHDQTVADDYFAAAQRVELRLDVAPAEPPVEVVQEEPEQDQLLI